LDVFPDGRDHTLNKHLVVYKATEDKSQRRLHIIDSIVDLLFIGVFQGEQVGLESAMVQDRDLEGNSHRIGLEHGLIGSGHPCGYMFQRIKYISANTAKKDGQRQQNAYCGKRLYSNSILVIIHIHFGRFI